MNNIERGSNIVKLLYNITENNFEEVKKLIQPMSVDINCTDSNGNIPLHYAVYVEDVQIVKYLLENKADMFIENNDNETPFDIAVERGNADIILVVGTEIINKSLKILKESEFETSPNTERNASNKESSNEEIKRTKRKISHLHKRLQAVMNNNGNLSYEQANLFILFLETFSLVCISKEREEEKEKVIKYFYGNDENMKNNIGKMRSIILKRSEHSIIELDGVKYAIECCYNGQNDFFIDLNQYLESQLQGNDDLRHKNLHKINFFKMFPDSNKQNVVKNDTVTKEEHIMQLKYFALKAYKGKVNWEQQWFEFIVNIYPGLGLNEDLLKKTNTNYVEKQLMHLRNNLVHEFYRFGVEEFKEAIIKLRGKFLEYYFAEIVYKKFQLLGVDPGEIEQSLNKDLEQLQSEFKMSGEVVPEEEAKYLFGYKFVQSVFPKKSSNNDNSAISECIKEYFKFMSLIEDLNRTDQEEDSIKKLDNEARTDKDLNEIDEEEYSIKKLDNEARTDKDLNGIDQEEDSIKKLDNEASTDENMNRTDQEEDSMKKIDNKARRELFEQFIRLRWIRENRPDRYSEEQKELMIKLKDYKVDEFKFHLVCKYYIEEGKGFDEGISKVITDVVKFIEDIDEAVNNYNDCKGINIIHLSEFILNKNSESKELVFSDYNNPNSKFKKLIEEHSKLMRLMDRVCTFNNVSIQVDNITLEINIKQTIKNIMRTFYDAYNEYKIEFNIKEIFSTESFLNELIWQDIKEETSLEQNSKSREHNNKWLQRKTFGSISNLIDLEFVSPYIVKLIESTVNRNKVNNIINKNNLIKLIDNLLNTTEYDKYLNILLNVELEGFKLYEILYDRILEKKINVKDISLIFEELAHLDKFIDVLLEKSTSIVEDWKKSSIPCNNDVIELIKNVVEIINQKACSKFESNEYKEESTIVLQILMKGREMGEKFVEILGENYPSFIDRELLIVKVKNRNGDHGEALKILEKLEGILKSDTIISNKTKYLLILSEKAYTICALDCKSKIRETENLNKNKEAHEKLFIEVTKYIDDIYLDDTNGTCDIIRTLKEKYNQIKDLDVYKRMLDSSMLLHSDKYLDLLKIAKDVAYWSNNNKEECINALHIDKEIYSCTKKHYGKYHKKTMSIILDVVKTYVKLSIFCWKEEDYLNSLYYNQSALNMYNILYNIQIKKFGPNHIAVKNTKQIIINIMMHVTNIYSKLEDLRVISKNISEYYQEVYKITDKIYKFFLSSLSDKDSRTNKVKRNVENIRHRKSSFVISRFRNSANYCI